MSRYVALEDRDWYREKPSEAWNNRFGRSIPPRGTRGWDPPPGSPTSCDRSAPPPATRHRRKAEGWVIALLPLIAAGWFAYDHRNALIDGLTPAATRVPPSAQTAGPLAPQPAGPESHVVRLSAQPGLDVPVSVVTKWWLSDPRLGQISVYVPVGKTPREALTVALAERGYQALP